MAPVAVVKATNTALTSTFGASSLACSLPSGIASGDLLIVAVAAYGGSNGAGLIPTLPSGWTSILTQSVNDTGAQSTGLRVFYKIATGSEGASVSVSWTQFGFAAESISARITGHDPAAPIDVSASATATGTLPSVTVTSGKTDSLLLRGVAYQSGTTPTTPSGYTALNGINDASTGAGHYAVYKTITASGATGTQAYATSPGGAIAWTVAVAPQPAQLVGMQAITNTPAATSPIGTVAARYTIGAPATISQAPTLGTPEIHPLVILGGAIDNTPTLYALGGEIRFTGATITNTPVAHAPSVLAPNTEQQIGEAATIVNTPTIATPASTGTSTPFSVGSSQVGGGDLVGGGQAELTGEGGLRLHYVVALPAITNTPSVYTPRLHQIVALPTIDQTAEPFAPRVRSVVAFTPAARILPWGASRVWNAWVEFVVAGEIVADSRDGAFALVGGKITEDITRSIARDASLSLAFPGDTSERNPLVPTDIGDLLDASSGTQFRVWAGYEGEEALLGTFDITSSPVKVDGGGAAIELQGQSLERLIQKAGFWQIEGTDDGSNVIVVIGDLVEEAIPDVVVLAESIATTTSALTWKPGDDRLSKIAEMASAAGIEFAFDRDSNFVMRKAPTIFDFGRITGNWEIVDGYNARVATLNGATREFSDDNAFNGVVIEGDSHSDDNAEPILYALWNEDPTSPLFFSPDNPRASRVGPRPKYIRSELVRTEADAVAMAQVELAKVLAISDSMSVEVPANALIEMGHYARVASESLGVDDVYRISRVTHDLAGGPAQLSVYRMQKV